MRLTILRLAFRNDPPIASLVVALLYVIFARMALVANRPLIRGNSSGDCRAHLVCVLFGFALLSYVDTSRRSITLRPSPFYRSLYVPPYLRQTLRLRLVVVSLLSSLTTFARSFVALLRRFRSLPRLSF
ncbi:hypothetical protein [Priestia megaterium]|uniref:hypothetical protein n=1 Tax=Priestia megaterium TaxID=1404 RepID=UPI0031FBD240